MIQQNLIGYLRDLQKKLNGSMIHLILGGGSGHELYMGCTLDMEPSTLGGS